ncbi:cysteine-rich RLK (RECEPTOR-like protein kinase) 8 [Abeliophyllum distichum]|uniref:Cysteine-rich RLK (RECEPTOR-like protein kinase) 8 n=1 Tax=Abeliophyllum distichum TaxID=126358 RepID=A0ABD1TW89_9LAMI
MSCLKTENDSKEQPKVKNVQIEVETHKFKHLVVDPSVGPQQNDVEENAHESPQQQQPGFNEPENSSLDEAYVNLHNYQLARDRKIIEIRPNLKYSSLNLIEYALALVEAIENLEPLTYKEAIEYPKSKSWIETMKEEMDSLIKNETWKLVNKSENQIVVQCKWLYKFKNGVSPHDPPRYKARLVIMSFTQVKGVDYNEEFSNVVKYKTIRVVLVLVSQFNWELE